MIFSVSVHCERHIADDQFPLLSVYEHYFPTLLQKRVLFEKCREKEKGLFVYPFYDGKELLSLPPSLIYSLGPVTPLQHVST